MAAQALSAVILAPEEEVLLQQMVLSRTSPAAVVTRARILLAGDEGFSLAKCAAQAASSLSTARRVCTRFRQSRLQWSEPHRLDTYWEKISTPLTGCFLTRHRRVQCLLELGRGQVAQGRRSVSRRTRYAPS